MHKLVFIHLYNDRSGSPKVLSHVIDHLDKKYDCELICSGHKEGFLSEKGDKCTRRTVFYSRSESKLLTFAYYLISQIHLFFISFRYIRSDAIFYVNTLMPASAAFAAFLMRKRVIYHLHETSIRPRLFKFILKLIVKVSADRIVCVSEYLAREERISGKDIRVIHNPLDNEIKVDGGSNEIGKSHADGFNLLMICSLKRYKGVFEFVKLAKRLVEKNISLTLVLNATDEEVELFRVCSQSTSNLALHSRQKNVAPFYRKADILLNLSRPDECVETFGLTILEGMAYGLPVIVPPVGGPAEIIQDGVEGFMVSCYEIERIVSLTLKLKQDEDLYKRMSASAKKRSSDFSGEKFNQRISELVKELLH